MRLQERTLSIRSEKLKNVKLVVVKVGSAVLTDEDGRFSAASVRRIAREALSLRRMGKQVVLVSSGAIAAGLDAMRLARRPKDLPRLQAAAAIGQGRLIAAYSRALDRTGNVAAQVLLTREDFDSRIRYLNARNTLRSILDFGGVPIVNENDTISTEEISFSDNDILSALVATMMGADLLCLLTVEDGLIRHHGTAAAERMDVVERIDEEITKLVTRSRTANGRGGMESKLRAAAIANQGGCAAVIANGKKRGVLKRILQGESEGTFFPPNKHRVRGRKKWLAHAARPSGAVIVDDGAVEALVRRGKSLLASGVRRVEGRFQRGDVVAIQTEKGDEIARGLVNYSAEDLDKIKGLKTAEIRKLLPAKSFDEVIHRDNLALSQDEG